MAIYPDKKAGKLTGRFRVEVQLDGKRCRGRFDDMKSAKAAELKWRLELTSGSVPTTAKARVDPRGLPTTLGQLFDRSAREVFRGQKTAPQSLSRLAAAVAIVGREVDLNDLSPIDIKKLIATLLDEDKAPATVNRYLSALHSLLAWGAEDKLLKVVPTFNWQSESEGRIRWITPEEEDRLLKAITEPRVAVLVKVAIRTGMRRSELLGLSEAQIEPEWVRLWDTKNGTPRSVPIAPETYTDLLWLVKQGMPPVHTIRHYWDKARASMGLTDDPWFVFHACRHTCATRFIEAGVDVSIVKQWLGHRRIETTLRYAHISDNTLRAALETQGRHILKSLGGRPPKSVPHPTEEAPHSPTLDS